MRTKLHSHLRKVHKMEKPVKCIVSICSELFHAQNDLNVHCRDVHPGALEAYRKKLRVLEEAAAAQVMNMYSVHYGASVKARSRSATPLPLIKNTADGNQANYNMDISIVENKSPLIEALLGLNPNIAPSSTVEDISTPVLPLAMRSNSLPSLASDSSLSFADVKQEKHNDAGSVDSGSVHQASMITPPPLIDEKRSGGGSDILDNLIRQSFLFYEQTHGKERAEETQNPELPQHPITHHQPN